MITFILGFIWGLVVTGWFMTIDDIFYKHPMFYFLLFYPTLSDLIKVLFK